MNSSSLEITENEYCIKLNKEVFNLTLVRQLIKRIQAEQLFFNGRDESCDEDFSQRTSAEFEENFDSLEDK